MGKSEKDPKENSRLIAKYSSAAFQMAAIVVLGALAGMGLDSWLGCGAKICTLILTLAAVGLAIYITIKDLTK